MRTVQWSFRYPWGYGAKACACVVVSRVSCGRVVPCLRLSSLVGAGSVCVRARGDESQHVRVVWTRSPVWVGVLFGPARLSSG